jgi:hypothetical protein
MLSDTDSRLTHFSPQKCARLMTFHPSLKRHPQVMPVISTLRLLVALLRCLEARLSYRTFPRLLYNHTRQSDSNRPSTCPSLIRNQQQQMAQVPLGEKCYQ